MKVDKAVCTDTMTDTDSAINYESLLSTLVQKKILAIKRECEVKKVKKRKRKQQNCLGSLIFGKRDGNGQCEEDSERQCDDTKGEYVVDTGTLHSNPSISQRAMVETNAKDHNILNCDDNPALDFPTTRSDNEHIESNIVLNCVDEMQYNTNVNSTMNSEMDTTECQIAVINERCTAELDNNSTQTIDDDFCTEIHNKHNINVKIEQPNTDSNVMRINLSDTVQRGTSEPDFETTSMIASNSNSPSIISQIEVSDEINAHHKFRTQNSSSDTISVPYFIKHTTSSAPSNAMALHDQEQRHQIRVLEAKSISAQCSPIFAQRQTFNGRSLHTNHAFFCFGFCFCFCRIHAEKSNGPISFICCEIFNFVSCCMYTRTRHFSLSSIIFLVRSCCYSHIACQCDCVFTQFAWYTKDIDRVYMNSNCIDSKIE